MYEETKHQTYTSYTGAEREEEVKQIEASLLAQQQCFLHSNKIQETTTLVSYKLAELIALRGKPFSDGDFIKPCFATVAETM